MELRCAWLLWKFWQKIMNNSLDYDELKNTLFVLDTDDSISSAHGILCGFVCVKADVTLNDWLNEILTNVDDNNLHTQSAHVILKQIFHNTISQLNDETLNFALLIAGDDANMSEQVNTLVDWCQGFLTGLGLQKISNPNQEVLEMIKDFSEIAKLDSQVVDSEENTQDLNEIIEFVRIGVLFIQETLQPTKQNYINPKVLH